jgi:heptosyltransferase-2
LVRAVGRAHRLVIVAPNWLGDAVMALPAVADVRTGWPDTSLTVAARSTIAPLFAMVPGVNAVLTLDSRGTRLPEREFDAALLLPNSFHAALVALKARIPERWGYRTYGRGPLLTRAVARSAARPHQVHEYQQLVAALGFVNGSSSPHLPASAANVDRGAAALESLGWDGRVPLVALAPGAAYGGAKRWPAVSFAELATALGSDGVATVMVGAAADAAVGAEVIAAAGTGARWLLNLIGRTDLPALAGVVMNCRAVVANDSGVMHLAAALGVNVTAIFGPTDERVTSPRPGVEGTPDTPSEQIAILTHPVWCRPCRLRECALDHRCMRGVGVQAALDATRRHL